MLATLPESAHFTGTSTRGIVPCAWDEGDNTTHHTDVKAQR
jgi:hypothetical protein